MPPTATYVETVTLGADGAPEVQADRLSLLVESLGLGEELRTADLTGTVPIDPEQAIALACARALQGAA
jgi:hypothetical protein